MAVRKTKSGHPNQLDAQREYDKTGSPPAGVTYSPYKNPPFRWAADMDGSADRKNASNTDGNVGAVTATAGTDDAGADTGTDNTNVAPAGTAGEGGASE